MATLQIHEPGSFATKVDLEHRWGEDDTIVIGVSREGVPKNHVSFRRAQNFLSRRQVTLWAIDGDTEKLAVRDGGRESDGSWSPVWKHTYLNSQKLSNKEWKSFGPGDRLRFHVEKPQCQQYAVQLALDTTNDTVGLDTVRFDTIQAWKAVSLVSDGVGTMLLSAPGQDGIAVVLRLDATAEELLGSEPGELKELEETLILNNLLPAGPIKAQLAEQIKDCIRYSGTPVRGRYDFGAGFVEVRLENRFINGQYALLGWVTMTKPRDVLVKGPSEDWKKEGVKALANWALNHPRWATVIALVLITAVVVIKVFGG